MDATKKQEILGHLPYALGHIDGGIWACGFIATAASEQAMRISVGGSVVSAHDTFRPLTNALVEAGLIYCRKLTEFLGIKVKETTLVSVESRQTDDAGIEHLDLPAVTVEQFLQLGPCPRLHDACVSTIKAAHKGVAHFVTTPEYKAEIAALRICSAATLAAVEEHVYGQLGLEVPDYRVWQRPRDPAAPA